ncbi:MAG: di-trans,poly-cis-decaprenylcistransferase [Chlamydiae bacterium RIFCSPHIGHO2_12_FULL_49_11]|nr:MAG: di-trans,poly-cis-decaprenylcistransferase [Chlamydiae bacterium RIFCSPHIGHO2_12_FULL_49_11]
MTFCIESDRERTAEDRKVTLRHVAIIMDGNRRWARRNDLPLYCGHEKGAEVLRKIVSRALDWKLEVLTVFAFSTENWKRCAAEVESLMVLIEFFLYDMKQELVQNGVRLMVIGDKSKLNRGLQRAIDVCEEATCHNNKLDLVVALNYGGRDEMIRAMQKAFLEHGGKVDFTEDAFKKHLDTARWPDPDLLIRTSGEKRISNFLLWQISYSEIAFCDRLWPDFSTEVFDEILLDFQKRNRRSGG